MDPTTILKELEARLNAHPDALKGVDALYRLHLTGPGGGDFDFLLRKGHARLSADPQKEDPTATVTMAAEDFVALTERRVSGMGLFMEGKIHIDGDMGVALRLEGLLRN